MIKPICKVNVLGTDYSVFYGDLNERDLAENDGICRIYDKEILLRIKDFIDGDTDEGINYRLNHVIRHELVHAIAEECGVWYGNDEHLVDWIAHIIPIVNKVSEEIKENANK